MSDEAIPPVVVKEPIVKQPKVSSQLDDDRFLLVRHFVTQGIQLASVVSPLLLLSRAAYIRSFSLNRFLRNNAVGTFAVGGSLGGGLGFARNSIGSNDFEIHDRAMAIRHNAQNVKAQDYSIVGGILGTLLTTSVLLRRVSLVSSLAGGAALGQAAGIIAYYSRRNALARTEADKLKELVPELRDAVHDIEEKARKNLGK